jgi:hypothetical protein
VKINLLSCGGPAGLKKDSLPRLSLILHGWHGWINTIWRCTSEFLISSSLFCFKFELHVLQRYCKRWRLEGYFDNPPANVSKVVGNRLYNLLKGVSGLSIPSDKLLQEY